MARAGLSAERVVEASADLADEVGLDNVTIAAVARRFGVKDASLYSHVRNLADLRVRIALLAAEELGARVMAAIAGRSGRAALVAFANAYRDYARAHPGRYTATHLHLPPGVAVESAGYRLAVDATAALLRGYGLEEPEATDAVRLLRSALHGYVTLEAVGGFGHPRSLRRSWERGIEALHWTLAHWADSEATTDI